MDIGHFLPWSILQKCNFAIACFSFKVFILFVHVAGLCPNSTVFSYHLATNNDKKVNVVTRATASLLCSRINIFNDTNSTSSVESTLAGIRSLHQQRAAVQFLSSTEAPLFTWTSLQVLRRGSLWIDVVSNETLSYTNFDLNATRNSTGETSHPMCVLLSKKSNFKWSLHECNEPFGQQALCKTYPGQYCTFKIRQPVS